MAPTDNDRQFELKDGSAPMMTPDEESEQAQAGQTGIPPGKIVLLNGYDRAYPDDGLVTPIDPLAAAMFRDPVSSATPKFAAEGAMSFSGGTWKVDVPGALGDMLFPRQRPLAGANLDPAVKYHVGGAIDSTVNPPVMDVQMIQNPRPARRQWILD
jgi:hypothetical protein